MRRLIVEGEEEETDGSQKLKNGSRVEKRGCCGYTSWLYCSVGKQGTVDESG
jgi:hypothetical protein